MSATADSLKEASGTTGTPATAPSPVPSLRPRTELSAGLLAAALAMAAYCAAMAARGTYPFGPRGRAINDLGNQFVPFHAHLWDLAHGTGQGDLFYNWNSAFGVPFLGDAFTYLANPFSWLTVALPRDAVNMSVFLATLLSIGLGTGLMTHYLGRLRPGSPWLRALLAIGFGLCAWTVNDASPDPMWCWALVSVPLIGICVDWALDGRRWVLGSLLVALCWFGNFYTAAMATLAAGLIALVRVCLRDAGLGEKVRSLLRAAGMMVVGVALAAPVLLVSLQASKAAAPMPDSQISIPGVVDQLAMLLPGSRYTLSVPNLAVGMLALLLLLAFPFARNVPVRERAAWLLMFGFTWASMMFEPTLILWQGGAKPNGSPFREVFVLSAMMVMIAWLCLTRRPGVWALLGATVLLGGVLLCARLGRVASDAQGPQGYMLTTTAVAGVLALGGLLALNPARRRTWAKRVVGAVLGLSVLTCSIMSVYGIDSLRDAIRPYFAPHETVSVNTRAAAAALKATDAWPLSRTAPGPHIFVNNDSELLDAQGGDYYSSYTPQETTQALSDLGFPYTMAGRHVFTPTDPASRAVFGITAYLDGDRSAPGGFVQRHQEASPLLTLHRSAPLGEAADNPFARMNDLLGAPVWTVPKLTQTQGPAVTRNPDGSLTIPSHVQGKAFPTLTGSCTVGSRVFVNTAFATGTLQANGRTVDLSGSYPMTKAGLRQVGTVGKDGKVSVGLGTFEVQQLPAGVLGCLDTTELASAVAAQHAAAPTDLKVGGHAFSATLPGGSTGYAVMATTVRSGWSCSVDGRAVQPVDYDGLFGIPLGAKGGKVLSCSYAPPGLKTGLAGSGVGLLGLLSLPGYAWLRRRITLPRARA
ncbi:YfhO family protein [Streptacidiphilus melanogenes]|uniref:YfhO family protein n=1 Tax=Streptacidiphilus melanogenes TaxID=411235 RepID=UPI000694277F|nr:YfhO family protein [Streptacidiphilus melanogenes]